MNKPTDYVLVRDFRKSDLNDVLDAIRLSFAEEFEVTGFDPDRAKKMADQMFGVVGRIFLWFLKLLGKEPVKFLVAQVDSRVVGTTMVTRQGNVGYISTVMVHPAYRRKGVARKLMMNALGYVWKRKMKRAVLHVISTNYPAKSLYTNLGFKNFEKIAYLLGKIDSLKQAKVEGIDTRSFEREDIDAIYDLTKSSEDPKHLEIFDFKKSRLKTGLIEQIFRFLAVNRIVAMQNNRLVGYVEATCASANEAGRIRNLQVYPELRSKGIEEVLLYSAIERIKRVRTKEVLVTVSSKRPELIATMIQLGFEKRLEMDGMALESA